MITKWLWPVDYLIKLCTNLAKVLTSNWPYLQLRMAGPLDPRQKPFGLLGWCVIYLSHICPWVPKFECWEKCTSKAETLGHTYQFNPSGQTRSCLPLAPSVQSHRHESVPKQRAVIVIIEDKWLNLAAILSGLSHCICFMSMRQKQINPFKMDFLTPIITLLVELEPQSNWPNRHKTNLKPIKIIKFRERSVCNWILIRFSWFGR